MFWEIKLVDQVCHEMIRPFINSEACGEFLCLAVRKHLSSFSFKLVATMHSYASNLCATFYDHNLEMRMNTKHLSLTISYIEQMWIALS